MTQVRVGWRAYVSPSGGGTGTDTDAQAFITATGITDSTQISALNTLVNDLKTYGLWTKMKALYPFVGGSADSHKFNLKDPRDLDAAYRLVFNGGWVHSSNGAKPNGTTGYANTFFSPSVNQSLTSANFSIYSRTSSKSLSTYGSQGCYQSSSNCSYIIIRRNLDDYEGGGMWTDSGAGSAFIIAATPDGKGLYMISRTGNNSLKFYKNGTSRISNTLTQSSTSLPTNSYWLGGNNGPLGGDYDNKELAFSSLGDGLTDTEVSNFYISVQKFQTTLGRHVGTPYVSDPDAIAFLNAAGITDGTQAAAINTLVIRMKADGVWTKMKAIYPFVGGSAASHKWNLKDPRDLDAAFRLVFSGGWVHSSTGALPNGTTGYAETYFIPSTSLTLYSSHLSYYSRTNSTRPTWTTEFSVEKEFSTGVISSMTLYAGSNTWSGAWITSTDSARAYEYVGRSSDFFIGSRTSVNNIKIYRNGLITGSSSIAANLNGYLGAQYPTYSPTIGARKKISTTNSVSYDGFSNRECSFASIGDGLTDGDASNLYSAVQAYQTTLGRQVNVPLVSDTDAQAFLNAANITSFQQASAVNKLVVDLKAAGVWTKMKALYPFVGGSATSHKWNLKDPRDLDAAYRLIFTGGWVHSSTGALPNGTTAYADTKLAPSAMGQNSIHASFYSRTNTPGQIWDLGSYDAGGGVVIGVNYINNNESLVYVNVKSGSNSLPNAYPSTGLYMANRISSTTNLLYRNGTLIINGTNTSFPPNNLSIYLAAYNGGTPQGYSTREQAFASIGDGLTDTEATAFYTAVQTFQTALGRAVNTPVYNNGLVLNLDAGNANSYPGTGTTWFDLATSTNGTLVNSPTFNSNQFTFNGSQFVNFGNTNNAGTDSVTLVAWVKTIANQDYAGIIGKAFYGDKLGRFSLHTRTGGKLGIITQNLQGGALQITEATSTQNINTGNWVFVVGVIDRSYGNKLYINGVLDGVSTRDTSGVNWSTTDNFTIGFYNGNGSGYFNGSISNAFMYRRVLTDNEIINLYNSTRGRFGL